MARDYGKYILGIAILNLFVALDTTAFWIGFFTEATFPIDELKPLIKNFEGYYAWERCFVVPDMINAVVATIAAIRLIKERNDMLGMLLMAAAAGAWVFLGVLDFTYGITNGMYFLGHPFSMTLLTIGIGLPIVGVASLWVLYKHQQKLP